MSRVAILGAPIALVIGAAWAQNPDAGVRVYQNVLKSTVWVHSNRGTSLATGSGSLIDRRRHLILTNYHVVGDVDRATVFFPVYRDGRPVPEKSYYTQRARELGIRGRVVARGEKVDLALIQIERVPEGAQALSLAPTPVQPGQTVHSIGNPGRSDALWVYTPGKVRQVYRKKWRAKLDRIVEFEADVVETDSPTNPGDSGGPLANDKGELVGVTEGGALDAQLLSTFVDVSEVQKLLSTGTVRAVPNIGSEVERKSGAGISDGANFFSADAIAKAKIEIDLILQGQYWRFITPIFLHANLLHVALNMLNLAVLGVFVERLVGHLRFLLIYFVTGLVSIIASFYFLAWLAGSERREQMSPGAEPEADSHDQVPLFLDGDVTEEEERRIHEALLSKFREKKYDEGLETAVRLVKEALAEQKP